MKIGILGGAGAMGGIYGGRLALVGEDVTLIDVWPEAVERINADGLIVEDKASGEKKTVKVHATTKPEEAGQVDMLMVFVKCYHTEAAIRGALPMLGADSVVITLQNGWGNASRIGAIVGDDRVVVGLTYNSGTLVGAGHVLHTGKGLTYAGELNGAVSKRLTHITDVISKAGFEVKATDNVLKEIWSKLALNVTSLPTGALLRFTADQLMAHTPTQDLMRALLHELIAVANAQHIDITFDERWAAISGTLMRAVGARGSMLQDVEKQRHTEIDVINGAIVEAGQRLNIPTPYNDTMLWMVKALEETFVQNS